MATKLAKNWLLLRGLARESGHWGEFVPLLQNTFPDATINLLDLPGTGKFYQQPSPQSINAITDHVRNVALAQGILQQPVTLLAISLGAMVAWDWLQRYPQDLCAASLMNTSFANLSPFYQRLRWQSYPQFISLLLSRNSLQREAAILQLVSNRYPNDPRISRAWADIYNQQPMPISNSLNQIIAAARYQPEQHKPQQPVLLLNGLGDKLVSPQCSTAIQQHWQLALRSHPTAGHDLTLDEGEWVAAQLHEWLGKQI